MYCSGSTYSMSLCTTYMAEEAATGDCRSPRDVRKSKVPGRMTHCMFRMRSSYDLLKKLEQTNLQVKCPKWEERTSSYGKFYCFWILNSACKLLLTGPEIEWFTFYVRTISVSHFLFTELTSWQLELRKSFLQWDSLDPQEGTCSDRFWGHSTSGTIPVISEILIHEVLTLLRG